MPNIIASGKAAIPVLISQLTDTRRTAEPIYDYWDYTSVGDIAHFILADLFLDSDWKTHTLTGFTLFGAESCNGPSWQCWHAFVRKHGRKYIQAQWQQAWEANKDRVYWDAKALCYRVKPQVPSKNR